MSQNADMRWKQLFQNFDCAFAQLRRVRLCGPWTLREFETDGRVGRVADWVKEVHGPDGPDGPGGPGQRTAPSNRSTYAEIAANAALVLIGVACALLDRQIKAQAAAFTEEGGFMELLYRIRTERKHYGPG